MVSPHPDLLRKFKNTDNILSGIGKEARIEHVINLQKRYPDNYLNIENHEKLNRIKPWTVSKRYTDISRNVNKRESTKKLDSLQSTFITDKLIVICIDFSDRPSSIPITNISNLMFSGIGDTFYNYYKENSYGKYLANGIVLGWYRAPQPSTYYLNNEFGFGNYPNNVQKLVEDSLNLAMSDILSITGIESYDINGNGYYDNILIIPSGQEAAYSGDSNNFWAHMWDINPKQIGNKYVSNYALTSEYIFKDVTGVYTAPGIICHEFGHLLGLPDLYDTDSSSNLKSSGAGYYSLMAAGSWLGIAKKPAHLDAWCKYKLGFINESNITINPNGYGLNLRNIENFPELIKYGIGDINEYFLIENRQNLGYDQYLPSNGLLIWHINENMLNNDNQNCYLVGLVQADNFYDLENNINNGDAGDSYPGSTNNRYFGLYSTPNAKLCNGIVKNLNIGDISNSGEIMTFNSNIQVAAVPASINVMVHGKGKVKVYKNDLLIGESSSTTGQSFTFDIGDKFKFVGSSGLGYKFDKYCADSGCTIISKNNPFEGTVTVPDGELHSYFKFDYMLVSIIGIGTGIVTYTILKKRKQKKGKNKTK